MRENITGEVADLSIELASGFEIETDGLIHISHCEVDDLYIGISGIMLPSDFNQSVQNYLDEIKTDPDLTLIDRNDDPIPGEKALLLTVQCEDEIILAYFLRYGESGRCLIMQAFYPVGMPEWKGPLASMLMSARITEKTFDAKRVDLIRRQVNQIADKMDFDKLDKVISKYDKALDQIEDELDKAIHKPSSDEDIEER